MTPDRFSLLVEGYVRGTLDPDSLRELTAAVDSDDAIRRDFEEQVRLHVRLGALLDAPDPELLDRRAEMATATDSPTRRNRMLKSIEGTLDRPGTTRTHRRRRLRSDGAGPAPWILGIAAVLVIAVLVLFATRPSPPTLPQGPVTRVTPSPRPQPPAPSPAPAPAPLPVPPPPSVPETPPEKPAPPPPPPTPAPPPPPPAPPKPAPPPSEPPKPEPPPAPKESAVAVAKIEQVVGRVTVGGAAPTAHLVAGAPVRTEADSSVVFVFDDGTRLKLGATSVLSDVVFDDGAKRIRLTEGTLSADVARQPARKPLTIETPVARLVVLGTRFKVSAAERESRLEVSEGRVRLQRLSDQRSVDVSEGHVAVVAPGVELKAIQALVWTELPIEQQAPEGDGVWSTEGTTYRQSKVTGQNTPTTNLWFKAATSGHLRMEVLMDVLEITSAKAVGAGAWGVGVVARFGDQPVVVRSLQNASVGSVLAIGGTAKTPYVQDRVGKLRLVMELERRNAKSGTFRAKVWKPGEAEPKDWMLETEMELPGDLTGVGLETVRASAVFNGLRVETARLRR